MNMKRLMDTTTILHFTSNKVKNDAPRKIRPVLDHFSQQTSNLYLPGENKVLDKSLKKYMSRLPHISATTLYTHFGVKIYKIRILLFFQNVYR